MSEVERLLKIIANPDIEPKIRADAGDRLAELGDPRPGVGLRPDGIPDVDWVEIPAGEFIFGGDEKAINGLPRQHLYLDTFYIARYPVTYAQYQAFVDTPDGIQNDRWWEGLAEQQKKPSQHQWPIANHPRENVSWYQSVAFCRWLSAKLGYAVSLPTEQQWEKAARGTDGRFYPWGNEYISGYANINEVDADMEWKIPQIGRHFLKQTNTVGIYGLGASAYKVFDMIGNVWEWCLNTSEDLVNCGFDKNGELLVRGGAWNVDYMIARAASRDTWHPHFFDEAQGFRVVCKGPFP